MRLLISRLSLKAENACDVGGKSQRLKVEHQLDVLLPGVRNAQRGRGQRPLFRDGIAFLDRLNGALHAANLFQPVVQRLRSAGPSWLLRRVVWGVIASRMLPLGRRATRKSFSKATRGLTIIGSGAVGEAQLNGGKGCIPAKPLRIDLVDGCAVEHVRPGCLFRVGRSEEHGARPEMVGSAFGGDERVGLPGVRSADDGDVLAKRREGLHRGGAPVVFGGTFAGGPGGSVDHFDANQAGPGRGRGLAQRRLRGDHGFE